MSLEKAIEHGKDHREPYRGSKSIDKTCRNHGGCPYCTGNRTKQTKVELSRIKQRVIECGGVYMYMTTKEANERELIIFGVQYNPDSYRCGGIKHFDEMSVDTAKRLVECGFLDANDYKNNSPTAKEFIEFCDGRAGEWYLHGYVVSPDRYDCRVTIEGIGSHSGLCAEDAVEFLKLCRRADELSCDEGEPAYCWYD